jgi:hypothetical protein
MFCKARGMLSWGRCVLAHAEFGLDEVSCLLDGFRKNVSFSFFVVGVVCV